MNKAVEQLVENAERLYSTLQLQQMRHQLHHSGLSEEEFKALLLEMVEPEAIITFQNGKRVCEPKPTNAKD
ncbi:MAG: hypothetical protein AAFR77_05175 [Cyanobacteria bacterium J06631_2]